MTAAAAVKAIDPRSVPVRFSRLDTQRIVKEVQQ